MNHLVIFIILIFLLCLFAKKNDIENFKFCKKLPKKNRKKCIKKSKQFKKLKIKKRRLENKLRELRDKSNTSGTDSDTGSGAKLSLDEMEKIEKEGYITFIDNVKYNNFQLCLGWGSNNYVRYTNYNPEENKTNFEWINGDKKRFIRIPNENCVWDTNNLGMRREAIDILGSKKKCDDRKIDPNTKYGRWEFKICSNSTGELYDDYASNILNNKCIKVNNQYISLGNKNEWGKENAVCNRLIKSENGYSYPYNYTTNENSFKHDSGCGLFVDPDCKKPDQTNYLHWGVSNKSKTKKDKFMSKLGGSFGKECKTDETCNDGLGPFINQYCFSHEDKQMCMFKNVGGPCENDSDCKNILGSNPKIPITCKKQKCMP